MINAHRGIAQIKPSYENDEIWLVWDIPEYCGREDEEESRILRPDCKIIFKEEKRIVLLEMTVPWIENREIKLQEKEEKYANIIRTLKLHLHVYRFLATTRKNNINRNFTLN